MFVLWKDKKEEMLVMKKSIKATLLGSAAVLMSVSLAACGNSNTEKVTKKSTAFKTEKAQSKQETSNSIVSSSVASSLSSQSSARSSLMNSSSNSSVNSDSSSKVATKDITPQQMGILLAMDQEPEVIDEYVNDNHLWYGIDNGNGETSGYNFISTHGDGTANIYWKVNGDMVTFKRLNPNSGNCVADEKLMTRTVSVSQLVQKYYSTPEQQSKVNNDVNHLQQGDN